MWQSTTNKCLDTPDECNDLDVEAAICEKFITHSIHNLSIRFSIMIPDDLLLCSYAELADDFCPFDAASEAYSSPPNYKASCRLVEYGVCEGNIYNQVRSNDRSMCKGCCHL